MSLRIPALVGAVLALVLGLPATAGPPPVAPAPPVPHAAVDPPAAVDRVAETGGTPPPPGARPRTGWSWPLSPRPRVLRRFDPPARRWLAGHRGVDLAGTASGQVVAAADGVVAYVGSVAGRPVLSIDHAGGLRSTYEPVVSTLGVGAAVRRGEVVGTLQEGHCTAAACLHWGVRAGEDYLDPLLLVGAGPPILLPLR